MQIPTDPQLPRISWPYIWANILAQFNLEKGLGYTLLRLLRDPGGTLHEFLFEDRRRLVKPITLLLLCVGITVFVAFRFLDLPPDMALDPEDEKALEVLPPAIREAFVAVAGYSLRYFNLTLISAIPFFALASFLLFRRQGLHYTEHLVINIYINCVQTLITVPAIPLSVQAPWAGSLFSLLSFGYLAYAYTRIFELKWWHGLGFALLAYLIMQFTYLLFLGLIILVVSLWM